jgi:putative ABC transport system permease protein
MLSLYRTLSLRYLGQRWFRAVLIVSCIALGVSTLVATRALNETMAKAAGLATNPASGMADLIVSYGEFSIPASLADELTQVPGVQTARPCIFENVVLPDLDDRAVLLVGQDFAKLVDLAKQLKKHNNRMVGDVVVSERTITEYAAAKAASLIGLNTPVIVGAELERILPEGQRTIRVRKNALSTETASLFKVGDGVQATGAAAALGGNVLILDLADAARVAGIEPGQVNRIDVAIDPTANINDIRSRIEKTLGSRAQVRTPHEQSQSIENVLSGMQTAFALCGIAALVVGLFLVYNALSISVAERRHEIGVLMSLGATRPQIRWLFAGEAAILGLAGSGLGIPLGIGLAYAGLQPVQDILSDIFFSLDASQVEISGNLLLVAVCAGFFTAVCAALVPAISASRENPADVVSRVVRVPSWQYRAAQVFFSSLMIVVGLALVLFRGFIGKDVGTYGGLMLVLIGALMATPLVAALAARLMQPFVRRFLSIEWRLAADNLVRAPGRTGLVIAALAAGVSLVMETAGTILSNRVAFHDWVQKSMISDLIVSSGSPVGAGGGSIAMDEKLGDSLAKLPEVEAVMPIRFRRVPFRDAHVFIVALDAKQLADVATEGREHSPILPLYRKFSAQKDAVLISENFAALHGVGVGDRVTLADITFTIVGTIVDYSWNKGTIYMNRDDYLRHWKDHKVDVYDLYLHPGSDVLAAKNEVSEQFGAQHALYVFTRGELQNHIDNLIERLYGVAYAQQVVVMIVAALGVVTALLISVLQRRREMGLLRAIGASQVQVIRSVLAEACLMGVIGTAIGVIVGVPIQWYCLQVVVLEETGFLFPLYVPWLGAMLIAVGAMTTAALAGLGPAIYAVRERIPEAIAYE